MRTRDHITEDHDHPLQSNSDPTAPVGMLLRAAIMVGPEGDAARERQRAGWAPRIVDPRTITTSRTAELQETPWTRR